MRALLCKQLGPADKLVIEQVPDPVPGPRQVVIDVKTAGLNFPDTLIISGRYQFKPDLPFSPGAEAAGVVSAVGKDVSGIGLGDRVIAMGLYGAFAEKMALDAATVLPMPPGMPYREAAGFSMTYGTSYYALKQRAKLDAGETLLVLGAAGGVGLAAVELGAAFGAKIIAAASTEEKLDVACEAGASMRINYSRESLKERAKSLTDGRGVDVVYDPVGGALTEEALRATAWEGRVLVVGFASGDIPRIPTNLALLKGASIVGIFWGAWTQRDPQQSAENFSELLQMFEQGKLKPHVSEVFAFEDYVEAFRCLTGRRAKGKVVLEIASD